MRHPRPAATVGKASTAMKNATNGSMKRKTRSIISPPYGWRTGSRNGVIAEQQEREVDVARRAACA